MYANAHQVSMGGAGKWNPGGPGSSRYGNIDKKGGNKRSHTPLKPSHQGWHRGGGNELQTVLSHREQMKHVLKLVNEGRVEDAAEAVAENRGALVRWLGGPDGEQVCREMVRLARKLVNMPEGVQLLNNLLEEAGRREPVEKARQLD